MAVCHDVIQYLENIYTASQVATADALQKQELRLLRVPDDIADSELGELCKLGSENMRLLMLFHKIVVSNVLLSISLTLEQQATIDGKDGTLQYASGGRRVELELLHDELWDKLLGAPRTTSES